MGKNKYQIDVSRRTVLKGAMAITAGSALAGCSTSEDEIAEFQPTSGPAANAPDLRETRKVYTTCPVECLTHGVNCQLVGDEVIRTEATRMDDDKSFTQACGRGLSRMQMLTEERALTPMKRIKKGTEVSGLGVVLKNNDIDEWVSISWAQALSEIGAKLRQLRDAQDPGVVSWTGSGNMGPIVNSVTGAFFGHVASNAVTRAGNFCCQGVDDGMISTYGARSVDTRDTVRDSQCIICWGNNPAETSNTYWKFFAEAKERGAKIITIDPRYCKTAEQSDQWVQLQPGTDSLFAIGMIREMFRKDAEVTTDTNYIDVEFLKHRTNAAFLVDYSQLVDGSGTFNAKAYNSIFNVKYHHVDPADETKAYVFDVTTDSIVEVEDNAGRNTATPTQDPNLYYIDHDNRITTAYNLMRALYAGDILTTNKPVPADLRVLHDPYYNDTNIANVCKIGSFSVVQDVVEAYCATEKKSMILQNMGGVQRSEVAGGIAALHCIISLLTGNIGDAGNGVDDTSGYATVHGLQSNDTIEKLSMAIRIDRATVTPHIIPFGEFGKRVMLANDNQAMDAYHPADKLNNKKDPQVKFWWVSTSGLLSQFPNTNAIKAALCSTEMVVVAKSTWNSDANYADYFLPVTTQFEYEDLGAGSRNKYVLLMEAGVKPYGQARSDMQIIRELAKIVFADDQELIDNFDHDDHWYVNEIITNPANNFAINGIPDYATLKEKKAIRPASIVSPFVPLHNHEFLGTQAAYKRAKIFITDWNQPAAKPLYANGRSYPYIDQAPNPARDLFRGPFPRYIPALNSHLEPLEDFTNIPADYQEKRDNYSLCAIQYKVLRTIHSSFTFLSWIREAFGDVAVVLMHPEDALARGIVNGDTVTVYNELGSIERVAAVSTAIKQGVVGLENGWWDKYGKLSASTIAAELPDPLGHAHTHNNTLVEIRVGGL